MSEDKSFKAGAKVAWSSHGGTAEGKVVRKLTSPIDIKGHHVAASMDNPEYLVETEDGTQAAHGHAGKTWADGKAKRLEKG